jgi:ribonuclease P protein component
MDRMKRRQEFVAAAKASYAAKPSLIVQARNRGDDKPPRVGFTATRKIGNAVIRNRVKRRLREVARMVLSPKALAGHDYVLIGRAGTGEKPFASLIEDLNSALQRLHAAPYRATDKGAP